MPNSKDEKGLRGPDKQQRALRDVREGAYDRGRVSRTRGQQSGQSGAEVPESAPPAETVPGTASKLPEGLQRPLRGPYNRDHGRNSSRIAVSNDNRNRDDQEWALELAV